MDELATRLRDDAAQIEATVSDELDRRLEASLRAVEPEQPQRRRRKQPLWFWVASSLSGVAAAAVVIVAINVSRQEAPPVAVAEAPALSLPVVPLDVRPAMLTTPLTDELDKLQSDLKRAEQAIREEVDRIY